MAFELTKEIIIVVHEYLIRRGGEVGRIRDEGTVDYVFGKINGADDVFEKAAWALYMSRLHPFYDGNKRTAFVIAAMILRIYRFCKENRTRRRSIGFSIRSPM
ncbi:MAG: Fic family protein [Methanothrix sp.]|nr:Fic family protein [Methanothrix sp.]